MGESELENKEQKWSVEIVCVCVFLEQLEYVSWLMMLSLTPRRGVCVETDKKGLAVEDKDFWPQVLLEILKVQVKLHIKVRSKKFRGFLKAKTK